MASSKIRQRKTDRLSLLLGHTNKHNEPAGRFCFSQRYPSPFTVEHIEYKAAEHWMMAQKALLFNNAVSFKKIIAADDPATVKKPGRKVTGFNEETGNENDLPLCVQATFRSLIGIRLLQTILMEVRDFLKAFEHFSKLEKPFTLPWKQYRGVHPLDAFWRMGRAEDLMIEFGKFYLALSNREKTIVRLTNPAPPEWEGRYKDGPFQ